MRKISKSTFLTWMTCMMAVLFFFTSCDDDASGESDRGISITAIEPSTARVGEDVVITGTGFDVDFSQNTVKFTGGINAPVKAGNATSLTVAVPAGAQSGTVQVTANNKTATSVMQFTLDTSLGDPVLTSLSPTNGFPGAEVVITGANFGTDAAAIEVQFGETEAEVSAVTATTITTHVPEAITGEVQVSVSRGGVSAANTLSYTVNPLPIDVKTVYWTTVSGVHKGVITETGVDISTLYSAENHTEASEAFGVVVDAEGGFVYWSTGSAGIYRAPVDGDGQIAEVVADNDYIFYDLALDLDHQMLYFLAYSSDFGTSYIKKAPMDGSGAEETVYSFSTNDIGVESIKLHISGDKLYWTDGFYFRVMEGSIDGSTEPQVLFDSSDGLNYPSGIAVDPDNNKIYLAEGGGTLLGSGTDQIYVGNLDGSGSLSLLVPAGANVNGPYDMEIDLENGYVFWMNVPSGGQQSEIMRANLDGSSVELLFDGFDGGTFFSLEIGEVLPGGD